MSFNYANPATMLLECHTCALETFGAVHRKCQKCGSMSCEHCASARGDYVQPLCPHCGSTYELKPAYEVGP